MECVGTIWQQHATATSNKRVRKGGGSFFHRVWLAAFIWPLRCWPGAPLGGPLPRATAIAHLESLVMTGLQNCMDGTHRPSLCDAHAQGLPAYARGMSAEWMYGTHLFIMGLQYPPRQLHIKYSVAEHKTVGCPDLVRVVSACCLFFFLLLLHKYDAYIYTCSALCSLWFSTCPRSSRTSDRDPSAGYCSHSAYCKPYCNFATRARRGLRLFRVCARPRPALPLCVFHQTKMSNVWYLLHVRRH